MQCYISTFDPLAPGYDIPLSTSNRLARMKATAITSILTLAFAGLASAYPSILEHLEAQEASKKASRWSLPFSKRQAPGVIPPFDAASQYVSTSGDYAFVAPGSGDQRGPCPGLNAMANQWVLSQGRMHGSC